MLRKLLFLLGILMGMYTTQGINNFKKSSELKYILTWNGIYGKPNLGNGPGNGTEIFERMLCPVTKCFMTGNRTLLPPENYDAVIFHAAHGEIQDLPSVRYSEQRYIFFLLESPVHSYMNLKYTKNLFNWTMTYRRDSDIVYISSSVVPRKEFKISSRMWLKPPSRTKVKKAAAALENARIGAKNYPLVAVAWMVSHCKTQSRREKYAAALSKYVTLHKYGKCRGCRRWDGTFDSFLRRYQRTFKFYLSFENSLCRDYVTEKLFMVLKYDIVPVVYGIANYTAIAPPLSYIDTRNFESPRHLAKYLQYLDHNPKEYKKFFWWKKYYEVTSNSPCSLCAKLHEHSPHKTYDDVRKWWDYDGVCKDPRKLN